MAETWYSTVKASLLCSSCMFAGVFEISGIFTKFSVSCCLLLEQTVSLYYSLFNKVWFPHIFFSFKNVCCVLLVGNCQISKTTDKDTRGSVEFGPYQDNRCALGLLQCLILTNNTYSQIALIYPSPSPLYVRLVKPHICCRWTLTVLLKSKALETRLLTHNKHLFPLKITKTSKGL